MPSSDPVQRFTDIIENIGHIERFTRGLDATAFAENGQTIFAVKYALVIISEAAIKLGDTAAAYSMARNPRPRQSASACVRFHRSHPHPAAD